MDPLNPFTGLGDAFDGSNSNWNEVQGDVPVKGLDCPLLVDLIAYSRQELSSQEWGVLKQHVDACPACQTRLASLGRAEQLLAPVPLAKPALDSLPPEAEKPGAAEPLVALAPQQPLPSRCYRWIAFATTTLTVSFLLGILGWWLFHSGVGRWWDRPVSDSSIAENYTPGHTPADSLVPFADKALHATSKDGILRFILQRNGDRYRIQIYSEKEHIPEQLLGFVFLDKRKKPLWERFLLLERDDSGWSVRIDLPRAELDKAVLGRPGASSWAAYRIDFIDPGRLSEKDTPALLAAIHQDDNPRKWKDWFGVNAARLTEVVHQVLAELLGNHGKEPAGTVPAVVLCGPECRCQGKRRKRTFNEARPLLEEKPS